MRSIFICMEKLFCTNSNILLDSFDHILESNALYASFPRDSGGSKSFSASGDGS